ncbi:MAG: ATP-dependent RNA helicase HrpA [Bifidobacteriaceae bacterium]|jgi:ATP-dependent helicase HrpA|nr:ATP-dependent RNA helicase HrpA [Bifidobacteriaceae bacterium]
MAARAGIVLPQIVYPPALPVSRRREEIASAIYANQVVIVAGETGSGKTTQLPKILLELGRGRVGQIGHTQPRRIAARTVAERIAEELDTPLGEVVGYQVRFTDTSSDSTMVKVMTDGILLAEIQRDPQLWAYDTIIVDEAHERSLNIDFLLGYLTNLAPTRPDLKLIITSATIDSQLFAKHFAHDGVPAPIVEVTGRTFPVEIRYHPLDVEPTPWDQPTGIVEAVRELMREGPGDILVFCSGEREIRDAADALVDDLGAAVVGKAKTGPRGGAGTANVEVLPLYTRLSAAEQHRVFEAHAARRVVLATNIAETSLTVPGIHYVVDPGTARISRYSKATKVQRLPIEAISQASANQRAGRCGRLADGICIRLYSEEDFGARPEYTEPEILRTSLASVILRMIAVGVAASPTDISAFPFVQPPDPRGVRDGMALLAELGAIAAADSGKGGSAKAGPRGRMALTGIGHTMAEIPIDPRLARMIVEAGKLGVVREATILAAALSIQDVRERPIDRRGEADAAHARFADSKSDFLTYLNLWEYLRDSRRELSSSAFRRAVRAEFLNYLRIREWQDLVTQLRRIVKPLGLTPAPRGDISRPSAPGANPLTLTWDASAIHRALLPGLLSQIGMRADTAVGSKPAPARGPDARDRRSRRPSRNEYVGARGTRFAIFPGSPLSVSPPPWIMAAELVETSRLWARDVAGIDPAWAEAPAGDLVRRVYAEPRWSAKRGAAIVSEKVLLYGLAIVPSRAVPLERTDPGQARELFIRRALVDGEWRTHHRFFHANRELLEQAEQLVQRTRNRSLAVDPEELFAFYDARVPASATSARRFDAWWKKARGRDPELLTLSVETLGPQAQPQLGHGFPDVWIAGDFRLSVTYEFAPGSARDGATVHIPIAIANQIPPDGFDWQVPGLRADLVAALIKSLPKRERVHLVPAPDTARAAVAQLGEIADWREPSGRIPPLTEALGKVFRETRDVIVPPEAWNYERVPDHLRLRFAVENRRGETMAAGLDLAAVVHQADPEIREAIAAVAKASGLEGGQEQADAPTADDAGPPPAGGAAPVAVAWPGERERVTTWDFGDLPSEIRVDVGGGVTARGYPALVVEDGAGPRGAEAEHVALRVVTDPARAVDQHARGVRTLLCRELGLPTGRVTSRLPDPAKLALASWRGGSVEALIGDIQSAAVDSLMAEQGGVPRTQGGYAILRGHLLDRLEDRVYRIALAVAEVLRAVHGVEVRLGDGTEMAALNSVADIRRHLDALVAPGFVTRAGEERLPSLRRYAAADAQRLDHLGSTKAREQQGIWLVEQMWEAYRAAVVGLAPGAVEPPALREIPWMIEELRVSLFAQQLGTAHPVSEQRIRRAIAAASTRGERR